MLKTEQVVNKIIEALEDNKAHRIVKIDLRKIENCFCSFFVICHGTSGTHIAGLTDAVEEKVREDLDERPFHIEGLNAAQWVVVDYGDIVVHIFEKELRDVYHTGSHYYRISIFQYESRSGKDNLARSQD